MENANQKSMKIALLAVRTVAYVVRLSCLTFFLFSFFLGFLFQSFYSFLFFLSNLHFINFCQKHSNVAEVAVTESASLALACANQNGLAQRVIHVCWEKIGKRGKKKERRGKK